MAKIHLTVEPRLTDGGGVSGYLIYKGKATGNAHIAPSKKAADALVARCVREYYRGGHSSDIRIFGLVNGKKRLVEHVSYDTKGARTDHKVSAAPAASESKPASASKPRRTRKPASASKPASAAKPKTPKKGKRGGKGNTSALTAFRRKVKAYMAEHPGVSYRDAQKAVSGKGSAKPKSASKPKRARKPKSAAKPASAPKATRAPRKAKTPAKAKSASKPKAKSGKKRGAKRTSHGTAGALPMPSAGSAKGSTRRAAAKRGKGKAKSASMKKTARKSPAKAKSGSKGKRKLNPAMVAWNKHVADYRKKHPKVSYKDALTEAKKTWKGA